MTLSELGWGVPIRPPSSKSSEDGKGRLCGRAFLYEPSMGPPAANPFNRSSKANSFNSLCYRRNTSTFIKRRTRQIATPYGIVTARRSSATRRASPPPLVNQGAHQARPAGLVRGAEAHARVAVEVFVE